VEGYGWGRLQQSETMQEWPSLTWKQQRPHGVVTRKKGFNHEGTKPRRKARRYLLRGNVIAHPPPSHHPLDTPNIFRPNPVSSIRRQEIKVFWFFSSEKNKTLLFLKKKKQKDFCLLSMVYRNPGLGRKVP
jgi:hypothetical protein